jgi:hypothetical protein
MDLRNQYSPQPKVHKNSNWPPQKTIIVYYINSYGYLPRELNIWTGTAYLQLPADL